MYWSGGVVRLGIPRPMLPAPALNEPRAVLVWLVNHEDKPKVAWTWNDACHLLFIRGLVERGTVSDR